MDLTKVVTIQGKRAGKTVTIMGGVHGDEPCGVEIVEELQGGLEVESGKVHLIFGSPLAIKENRREFEGNLNRAFRPQTLLRDGEDQAYERRRALEIMPYLRESDALLDIHSSFSEESTPFVICEPHSFVIAHQLPFPIRSWGWDAIHPGGTDYFVNRCGGMGICVECGYNLDPAAPARARTAVEAFLSIMGCKEGPMRSLEDAMIQREIYAHGIYHTITDFVPSRKFGDFESITKSQLLGTDGGREIRAERNGVIIFVRQCSQPLKEAFVLGLDTSIFNGVSP